jgi:hypothetical protein
MHFGQPRPEPYVLVKQSHLNMNVARSRTMSTAWSCELENCSMSFSRLRRLDFHRKINSKNLGYHHQFTPLDDNSGSSFACEVCLSLWNSGYRWRPRELIMKVADLQWSGKDSCPTCRIICEGLLHCDLSDDRAIVTWPNDGTPYAAISVTNRPID